MWPLFIHWRYLKIFKTLALFVWPGRNPNPWYSDVLIFFKSQYTLMVLHGSNFKQVYKSNHNITKSAKLQLGVIAVIKIEENDFRICEEISSHIICSRYPTLELGSEWGSKWDFAGLLVFIWTQSQDWSHLNQIRGVGDMATIMVDVVCEHSLTTGSMLLSLPCKFYHIWTDHFCNIRPTIYSADPILPKNGK